MTDKALPFLLPQSNAYLLLDGISVESLPQRLYEWAGSPEVEVLYLQTPWADLCDVSPCLLKIISDRDAAFVEFVTHQAEEWGYLIFSSKEIEDVASHLRKLVSVVHPLGKKMLLRLADPAVAQALFGHAIANNRSDVFGPINQMQVHDAISGSWHSLTRPGEQAEFTSLPYRLSEMELAALGEVDFRRNVSWLLDHMRKHFPHFIASIPEPEHWDRIYQLASQAYQSGFASERDIALYANLFGFLGLDALDHHPDIAELVTQSSQKTPSQRIEQAARLAETRMALLERNSI